MARPSLIGAYALTEVFREKSFKIYVNLASISSNIAVWTWKFTVFQELWSPSTRENWFSPNVSSILIHRWTNSKSSKS
jgi:hypothetical protein